MVAEKVTMTLVPIGRIQRDKNIRRDGGHDNANMTLGELAASIKTNGMINPLTVRADEGGMYTLIAGYRRYDAAKRAGLTLVPVVIRDDKGEDAWIIQIAENVHRSSVSPIDEGRCYSALHFEHGYPTRLIAHLAGKDEDYVQHRISLFTEPVVRTALEEGRISQRGAESLIELIQWFKGSDKTVPLLAHEPHVFWNTLRQGGSLSRDDIDDVIGHYHNNHVPHDADEYARIIEGSKYLIKAYRRYMEPQWYRAEMVRLDEAHRTRGELMKTLQRRRDALRRKGMTPGPEDYAGANPEPGSSNSVAPDYYTATQIEQYYAEREVISPYDLEEGRRFLLEEREKERFAVTIDPPTRLVLQVESEPLGVPSAVHSPLPQRNPGDPHTTLNLTSVTEQTHASRPIDRTWRELFAQVPFAPFERILRRAAAEQMTVAHLLEVFHAER